MAFETSSESQRCSESRPSEKAASKLVFALNWRYCRPLLKRLLPPCAHRWVRQMRERFQPALLQYPPMPLRIPKHYATVSHGFEAHAPTVSIVTPSFNQAQFLERTIQSVLTQSYPRVEYVIQDGNSSDATDLILQRYQCRLTHVESGNDRGQAHAINRGFQHTRGDIMAWLNADDLLLPGAIPYVVRFFLEHPDVDVVYGHRLCLDEHDREIGRWILPPHDDSILPWANYLPQETVFWRRRMWERVGGYLDESYQFVMDWDLFLRFQHAGARFVRLPRFLGAFRVHAAQKTSVLAHLGTQEACRLHTRYHGRPVSWLEIRYHVRHYLAQATWLYILHNLHLFRQ